MMQKREKGILASAALHCVMALVSVLYLIPVYMVFNYAFKDTNDLNNTSIISLPTKLFLGNFKTAIKSIDFSRTLWNTSFMTFVSVVLTIVLSSMAAFTIARRNRNLYKLSYFYFIAGILVPYQAIFVPIYIIGKNLGFVNNPWGVIFLYIATNLSFAVFVATGFMKTIPIELEEAAIIDGCSVMRLFWSIVLPLLKPVAATLAILLSFQIWNDFLMASLFLQKTALKTFTLRQQLFFGQYVGDYSTAFAAIIMSALPIIIVFLSMQKHFIKGIVAGAVKG